MVSPSRGLYFLFYFIMKRKDHERRKEALSISDENNKEIEKQSFLPFPSFLSLSRKRKGRKEGRDSEEVQTAGSGIIFNFN